MLPTVDFCGLNTTRLIVGANPFGGFSHQTPDRDEEMRSYYTIDRILETWERAEAAGINTMITNNESTHVVEAVRKYLHGDGKMQWIGQLNRSSNPDMLACIDEAAEIGACAVYFHGGQVDTLYTDRNEKELGSWVDAARQAGLMVGVAGHAPEAHLWVNSLDIVDFHAVCCFNCGSLHDGKGELFKLADLPRAIECIREIQKPCIVYKIMGAGRIDARMAFEYAFDNIKPIDVINVGMYRGDKDDMVAENASIVEQILGT